MSIVQKYVPKNLDEVVFADAAVREKLKAYGSGNLLDNLILTGPNGSAKSTVARLLPLAARGADAYIESKHADELVDYSQAEIIDYIGRQVHFAKITSAGHYYIIFDEFDKVQGKPYKLWNAIDRYAHELSLIITTNNPMDIEKSIRSRCDVIEMKALKSSDIYSRADFILKEEGVTLPKNQLMAYLRQLDKAGDIRSYLRMLDQIVYKVKTGSELPAWQNLAPQVKKPSPSLKLVK